MTAYILDAEFWLARAAWPSERPGLIFLGEALHQVGKHFFGAGWTGEEPLVTSRLNHEKSDEYRRLSSAASWIASEAATSRLMTSIELYPGEFWTIDQRAWAITDPAELLRRWFRDCRAPFGLNEHPNVAAGRLLPVFVRGNDLSYHLWGSGQTRLRGQPKVADTLKGTNGRRRVDWAGFVEGLLDELVARGEDYPSGDALCADLKLAGYDDVAPSTVYKYIRDHRNRQMQQKLADSLNSTCASKEDSR